MNPSSRPISNGTSTITINPQEDAPKHLVLRLRGEREELKNKIQSCESTQKLQNKPLIEITSNLCSTYDCITKPKESLENTKVIKIELKDESDSSGVEEYELSKSQQNVELLLAEDEVLGNAIDFAEADVETEDQLGIFDTLLQMASDYASTNGTQIISAFTTMGVGIQDALSDGYVVPLVGVGLLAVAVNEFYKMHKNYVNDKGASDHLRGIEMALESLGKKNELAKKTISEASEKQQQIKTDLKTTQEKIEFLNNQLINTTEEFHKDLNEALDVQHKIKEELENQGSALNQAIGESTKACEVIANQIELLNEFKSDMETKEIQIKSEEDLQNIMAEIKRKINEIAALSSKALKHQTQASRLLISALDIKGNLFNLNELYLETLLKLQILEKKYKEAQGIISEVNEKLNDVNQKHDELGTKLDDAKEIIDDQKTLIEIAQDELEAEKQRADCLFGTESVNWGGMGAILTGFGAGFITFGPPGAVVGVFAVGICGIKPAVSLAHVARKTWKSYCNTNLDLHFKSCKENLTSKFNPKTKTKVTAEFGASTAKFVGIWRGGTAFQNYLVCPINNILTSYIYSGPQLLPITSHKVGTLKCTFGGITLPELPFNINDQENPNHTKYGAITVVTQFQLGTLLLQLLMEDVVSPETVLEFLKQFEKVEVIGVDDNHQQYTKTLCMIHPKSKAMKTLKKICEQKIAKVCKGDEILFEIKK